MLSIDEQIKEIDERIAQLELQATELWKMHHQRIGSIEEKKRDRELLLNGKGKVPKEGKNDSNGK